MTFFRTYLVLALACLGIYTLLVGMEHGWNLLPLFFDAIARRSWQGQFNADFLTCLGLSAIWVTWRHHLSIAGIGLGVVALFGGMMFLAPYLLWASARCNGSAAVLLLGERRAGR